MKIPISTKQIVALRYKSRKIHDLSIFHRLVCGLYLCPRAFIYSKSLQTVYVVVSMKQVKSLLAFSTQLGYL